MPRLRHYIGHGRQLMLSNGIVASASLLMTSSAIAQAFSFCMSFVLGRIYTPAEYGHYAIFVGCAVILAVMATGALDRVILLAESDAEARKVATVVMMMSTLAAAGVSVIGCVTGAFELSSSLPLTTIDLALLIPTFMMCYAGAQVFTFSSLRANTIKKLAIFRVAQSVTTGTVQLLVHGIKTFPGLAVGSILGWSILMVAGVRWRLASGHVRNELNFAHLLEVVRRHSRYPRYIMPNEVLDNLSNQAPIFLISMYLSLTVSGYYGIAILMLSVPSALVGQAVGQAFLQHLGNSHMDASALSALMKKIWAAMALIGLVPFFLIYVFGPELFAIGFGSGWVGAGEIAQQLAPLLLLRFISSPTSSVYLKLNLQREQWYFCVAAAVYRTGIYGMGFAGLGLKRIIFVHVVVEMAAIIAYNFVALRRLNVPHGSAELVV